MTDESVRLSFFMPFVNGIRGSPKKWGNIGLTSAAQRIIGLYLCNCWKHVNESEQLIYCTIFWLGLLALARVTTIFNPSLPLRSRGLLCPKIIPSFNGNGSTCFSVLLEYYYENQAPKRLDTINIQSAKK